MPALHGHAVGGRAFAALAAGHRLAPAGLRRRAALFDKTVRVAINANNVNAASFGAATGARRLRLIVSAGVTLGSVTPGTAAVDLSALHPACRVQIDNYGNIYGAGGVGGTQGGGGTAVKTRCRTAVRNLGEIGGGGGGDGGYSDGKTTADGGPGTAGATGGGGVGGAGGAPGAYIDGAAFTLFVPVGTLRGQNL